MHLSNSTPLTLLFKLTIPQRLSQYLEAAILFPVFKIYFSKHYSNLNIISKDFVKDTKLKKRFIVGAYLGYKISKYILKNEGRVGTLTHFKNGIKYGHWGITIIALDHTQDSIINDSYVAKQFSLQCINIITKREYPVDKESLHHETGTIQDAATITLILCHILSGINETNQHSKNKFVNDTIQLLSGQLYSMEQKHYSETKNFKWYYNEVLNQKTLNFFLTPISLFCRSNSSTENFRVLEKSFLTLNQCYFHWQLIDDVADLNEDIKDSLITAPAYILLSQGQLAEKLTEINLDQISNGLVNSQIEKHIEESALLLNYLPFSGNINSENIYDKIKFSLCNSHKDFDKSLKELINEKIFLKNLYERAYLSNNFKNIRHYIRQSKTCNRILSSTFNPLKIHSLEEQFSSDDLRLKISMRVLNLLIEKCYIKALKTICTGE